MTITAVPAYQGQPGTTDTLLFTAAGNGHIVKEIIVVNATSAAATIAVSVVPSGGTAGPTHWILPTTTIPALSLMQLGLSTVMASGSFLSAAASAAASITLTISGVNL